MSGIPSAMAAARRLCERSGWTLTNLELQKMLYLAQMVYMANHKGEPLFNGRFEAWDYGPVLPSVYSQVRAFGSGPIKNIFQGVASITDPEQVKTLDDAYDQLSKRSASQLVSITHWQNGAWAKRYRPGERGITISDDDIREEARKRAEHAR